MQSFVPTFKSEAPDSGQQCVIRAGIPNLIVHPLYTSLKGIIIGIIVVSLIVVIG